MTTNFHALGRRGRIKIMNFLDLRKEEGGGGVLKWKALKLSLSESRGWQPEMEGETETD